MNLHKKKKKEGFMICPYINCNFAQTVGNKYDADGNLICSVTIENWTNRICLKENCGAYYKGKCRFNK